MQRFALALMVFVFSASAHADLLLEPYAGYFTGSYGQAGTPDEDLGGVTLGGRIGYQMLGFMVGGELMTGKWSDDADPSLPGGSNLR